MNLVNFMMPTNAPTAITLDGSMIIVIGVIALAYILIRHRNEVFDVDENAYKDTVHNKNTLEIDVKKENIENDRNSSVNTVKASEEEYDETPLNREREVVFNRR